MNDPFDHQVTAVVGVAKNCGKTTTLDYLLTRAMEAQKTAGVVSVGIDGEKTDVLLGTPKPQVVLHRGQLVASTRLALEESDARVEYVEALGFTTPLGEAVVARVLADGAVVLAGMRHREDVRRAVESMVAHGAERVLIDGAYGRVVAAHPELADAVVVSTGAVVSPRVDVIADKTAALVERLSFPRATEPWHIELLEQAMEEGRALLGGESIAPVALGAKSALLGLPEARELWKPDVSAIAIPGLVSDRVLNELLRVKPARTLLVADGTSVQGDDRLLRKLRRSWPVFVHDSAPVVAIAYNATSVRGPAVRADHLAQAIALRCPKMPVFDPIVGLQ